MCNATEIATTLEEMAKDLNDRRDDRDVVVLSHGEVQALIHNLEMQAQELRVLALGAPPERPWLLRDCISKRTVTLKGT